MVSLAEQDSRCEGKKSRRKHLALVALPSLSPWMRKEDPLLYKKKKMDRGRDISQRYFRKVFLKSIQIHTNPADPEPENRNVPDEDRKKEG